MKFLVVSVLLLIVLHFCGAIRLSKVHNSSEKDIHVHGGEEVDKEVVRKFDEREERGESSSKAPEIPKVAKDDVGSGQKKGKTTGQRRGRKARQDCSCYCNSGRHNNCKMCGNCPRAHSEMYWGVELPQYQGPTIAEAVVETLPNIPIDLADTLVYMQPQLVNFVIESHVDLASLVAAVHPQTLEYIVFSAPNFPRHLSQMHPEAIYIILSKIPFPCQYLQSLEYDVARRIVLKLPEMGQCLPMTTTTTTTTTPAPPIVRSIDTVPEPAVDVESMFTREELEEMTAQVAGIKKLLMKANPRRVAALRIIHPNFMDVFDQLSDQFIDFLKALDSEKLDSKTLGEVFMVMAGKDAIIHTFAKLFI